VLDSTDQAPQPDRQDVFVATEDGGGGAAPDTVAVQIPGLPAAGEAQCTTWAGDGSHRIPMQVFANQVPAVDSVRIQVTGGDEAGSPANAGTGQRADTAPRPDATPRADTTPRADGSQRTDTAPRTDGSQRTDTAPRTDGSQRTDTAPRTDGSQRTDSAPRTDGGRRSDANQRNTDPRPDTGR
jgi:hypothetical protein